MVIKIFQRFFCISIFMLQQSDQTDREYSTTLLLSDLSAAELITDEDVLTERVFNRVSIDSHYSHHLPQITSCFSANLEWIADIIDYLRAID